jgi:hypothetical protein
MRQRLREKSALEHQALRAAFGRGRPVAMCGRYTYKLTWEEIVKLYRLTLPDERPEKLGPPSYNVAPTHVMPIIRPAR